MSTGTQAGGEPRPDFLARFLSVVPLLVLYFALAALYAWQASRRPVPTLFTDELELTQLARAIAHTGEPARRGVPYGGFASLVCLCPRPGLVAGIVDSLVGGGEADPRPRDDRDDLSGVRAGADGRAEVVRARRSRRGGCSARARVRADPRRGAARVPDRDARPLADRTHARAPELGSRRSRVRWPQPLRH